MPPKKSEMAEADKKGDCSDVNVAVGGAAPSLCCRPDVWVGSYSTGSATANSSAGRVWVGELSVAPGPLSVVTLAVSEDEQTVFGMYHSGMTAVTSSGGSRQVWLMLDA